MPQEQRAHQRDDKELLAELVGEIAHGIEDQSGTVVGRYDFDAWRKTCLQRGQLLLDRFDGGQRVLARAQDHHAAGHLSLPVELGNAAPQGRPALHRRHVLQQHRHTIRAGHHRHVLEVLARTQVAFAAHHEFGFALLDHRAAGRAVRGLDRIDQAIDGDAARCQRLRIRHDLPRLHHAANAGDFGHVGHGLEVVT